MFTVSSDDWTDGERMPHIHVLNGMGLDGGNLSPPIALERCARRNEEFHHPDP